ncbi:MAG: stage II sporulation protein M [Acidobacteriota bacterium]
MDYQRFVQQRQDRWRRFESELAELSRYQLSFRQLEQLAFTYRQVLHDQALAATRFPGTPAHRLLRRLALSGTRALVRQERRAKGGIAHFFFRTFPATFRRALPVIGVAVALFLVSTLFGFGFTLAQPSLGLLFLGPEAVEGLAQGEMWTDALVTSIPPAASTSMIATNNVGVGITAFAGGITAGFLTTYVLVLNGIMLGSVVGITMHFSMQGRLLEFISAHGPLELSLIMICAAAGYLLARGLVTAGDEPRARRLGAAAREAGILLAGCLPWFVVLAFIETLISPQPYLSPGFKLSVGLAFEAFFLFFALNPFSPPEAEGLLPSTAASPQGVATADV